MNPKHKTKKKTHFIIKLFKTSDEEGIWKTQSEIKDTIQAEEHR